MKHPHQTFQHYNWETARRDLAAGATVAAIAVPQSIAYALIAGVDPRFGLYSAIIVTIVASLLGSSSHLINGPTNAISLVVFSVLSPFDAQFDAFQALFLLSVIVGSIQIVIAVFRLGDLTRYISESVVLGFMAGAGLLVGIGQIGNFLGSTKKALGNQSVLERTWDILAHGGPFNNRAIGLGLATVVLVLLLRRLFDHYKFPRLDMLAGLLIVSLVAVGWGWSLPATNGKTLVSVVGSIPAALPSFHIPQIQYAWIPRLSSGALAIALLGLLEAIAVAKSIATYTRQSLDFNRQCLAEGVGNLIGGFFQSLTGSGSLTRSAINYQSGAVTRLSGVYSGLIVAAVVVFLGPYARFIPKSVLAGLLFITAGRLIDWPRLFYAVRASRYDAALVAGTAFAAIFISVEDSILIGVAISILLFVPRASKLGMRELIVTPEGVVRERLPNERRNDAVLIYDLEGEIFFGAAPELERYFREIQEETERSATKYVVLRLRRTRNPDAVVVEHLERFIRERAKQGVTVFLAGLRPDFSKILKQAGFEKWLSPEQVFPEEGELFSATVRAVRRANKLWQEKVNPQKPRAETGIIAPSDELDPLYYLV